MMRLPRIGRALGAVGASLVMLLPVSAAAKVTGGDDPSSMCVAGESNSAWLARIDNEFAGMVGAGDAEIEARVGLVRVDGNGRRIQSERLPTDMPSSRDRATDEAANSPDELALWAPRFYSIVDCQHVTRTYISADFSFQGRWPDGAKSWAHDGIWDYDVGQNDGFGLALNRSVYLDSAILRTCDYEVDGDRYACGNPPYAWDISEYGVAWRFQDQAWFQSNGARADDWGINNGNGRITFRYRHRYSPACIFAVSKYVHTWSDGYINGIGVGVGELSVSRGTNGDTWEAARMANQC